MRRFALLTFLAACSSLSQDQADQLSIHQRNAALYFEGGKFDQAFVQVERGLSIDPDDYKLNAIRGALLLRASGNDGKRLDEATAQLARVYEWRSQYRHEPYLLFHYALAEQKQGLRRLAEAIRTEDQATRAPNDERKQELLDAAADSRAAATERLRRADGILFVLIDRGELLRIAHNHRAQIALQLGDDDGFLASTEAFLEQSKKDQEANEKKLQATVSPQFEAERLRDRQVLRSEEIDVRAMLADFHYQRQNHEAALAQLNRVLELDPKRSVDYYNRGRVLLAMGERDKAKDDFGKFIATTNLPPSSDKRTFAAQALRQ